MKIEFESFYQTNLIHIFYITRKKNFYKVRQYQIVYDLVKIGDQYHMGKTLVDNKDFLHALKLYDRKLKLKKLLK